MRRCLPLLPLAAALWAVANWWPRIRNEFFVIAGSRNESGGWYGFHSGFGGSAYITVPIFLTVWWWHHQCGVSGCYWYAWRTTAAGEPACFIHHPHKKRTVEDLHAAHHAAVEARAGGR